MSPNSPLRQRRVHSSTCRRARTRPRQIARWGCAPVAVGKNLMQQRGIAGKGGSFPRYVAESDMGQARWQVKRLAFFRWTTFRSGFTFSLQDPKRLRARSSSRFRFHDLRHTTASYLTAQGASLLEIADTLGHKTLSMVKLHSHLAQSHRVTAIEKMAKKMVSTQ
jgi:Phage integrase family